MAQDERSALIFAFPRTPFYGGALLVCTAMVPARKIRSACLRFLPAPLGPGWSKFAAGAVFGLRLSMLSQRSRSQAFPQGGRTIPPIRGEMSRRDKMGRGHGDAVTDEDALLDRNPYSNGRAGEDPAPTAKAAPWTLVRQSQARLWSRSSDNFCKPRAQWPGWNRRKPLRFCAPEILLNLPGTRPP